MNLDPIAPRVLHRYRRQILGTTRIEYSDAGTITAVAIARLLEPTFGPLHEVTFRPGVGAVVHFEALTHNGQSMEGRVALYAAVGDGVIISWGEVLVDALGEISVVARHVQSASADARNPITVVLADGGIVTVSDVARLLEGHLGPLKNVRFILVPGTHEARWKACSQDGRVVSGWLSIHARLRAEEQVIVWAEITIDRRGEDHVRRAHVDGVEGTLDTPANRLAAIARRARLAIRQLVNDPEFPATETVANLTWIVEEADGDAPLP